MLVDRKAVLMASLSDILKVELMGAYTVASTVVWMAVLKDAQMDLKMVGLKVV